MEYPNNENPHSSYDDIYAKTVEPKPSPLPSADPARTEEPYQYAPPTPYATSAQPVVKKQGKGWIVAIVIVALLCLTMMFGISSCNSMMTDMMRSTGYTSFQSEALTDRPSIGVIEMGGTIQYDGTTCSPEGLKAQLDRAEKDNNIQGVILHVNSGGGTATAGEEMALYVKEFSKPIVVSTAATNASAAYEISSQADYIFADKTSMVGAIGVYMQLTDLSGLYQMLGINIETIKSSDAKDAGSGSRPLTVDERAWYQKMVDQINEDFIQTVAEGRGMDVEEVRSLATGLPFTGIDGVENGLVDEIGNMDAAVSYLSQLLGHSEDLKTVKLVPTKSDLSKLIDMLGESEGDISSADKQELLGKLEDGLNAR